MDTRSRAAKLTEDELEQYRLSVANKDARVQNEAKAVEKQLAKLDKERAEFAKRVAEFEERTSAAQDGKPNPDQNETFASFKSEILHEFRDILRREVDKIRSSPAASPEAQRTYEREPAPYSGETLSEPTQPPRISFREVTETVPSFNGYNIPLSQFIRACRRAREMVPASAETSLTKVLINKLRGFAYYAVEDEPCETVSQLADLLSGAFGPQRDVDQCRGDLANIFRKGGEHMLEYISRAKTLRNDILDAERRSRGRLDHRITAEIDALTTKAFCNGLGLEYRLQMRPAQFASPFDAFAEAKILAGREELDRSRVSNRSRNDNTPSSLAHSTPRRNPTFNYSYVSPERDRGNPRNSHTAAYPRRQEPRNDDTRGRRDDAPSIWCRYCKHPGHEINECRKRQYNNSRQGNYPGPSNGPDASRGRAPQVRPIRPIESTPEEKPESESSN